MNLTKYPDINKILHLLKNEVVNLLGDNLVGLYLTGSLTYGGFDNGSSDIDFLVVTNNPLTKEKLHEIEMMHHSIGKKFPKWRKRIDGSYITKKMLLSKKPPNEPRPYFNAGKMWSFVYGNEWLLNLFQLYEYGIALEGPDPKNLIQTISITDVINASRRNLLKEWMPKLKEKNPFENPDYDRNHLQAYAALSMCRILYTAKNKEIASKKKASQWAKITYGNQWGNLIEKAENWKHGEILNVENEILGFIRFTISETA